ncbi:MAG: TetR/AcrR family transcriptional regulator [Rhizomicrobium sp.]|nr:TetR/AcrR family transcriptional regulator [Rhizomicrobium sp.]
MPALHEIKRVAPDARRHAILDVAHRVFIRDGYAGASMSRIAAEVGGSKTTLYNHFESKKELFVAVTERETARLLDEVFVVEALGGDFASRIAEMARRMLSAMLTDDMVEAYRMIVAESGRFPEVGSTAYAMAIERGVERLSAFFTAAMEEGALRRADTALAAQHFIDLASGTLLKKRVWNVVTSVNAETIAAEAASIAGTFLAAFGSDAISAAARRG